MYYWWIFLIWFHILIVLFFTHTFKHTTETRHMTRTFRSASLLFYFAFSTHTLCENTSADLSSRASSPLMKLYSVIGWGCHSFQWWLLYIVPGNHTWPDCQHCERIYYHLSWWGKSETYWSVSKSRQLEADVWQKCLMMTSCIWPSLLYEYAYAELSTRMLGGFQGCSGRFLRCSGCPR